MKREYLTILSPTLQRSLEMLVFGHGGKPMLVFPSSEGRFFDYEDFGMINTISDFIETGKIRVFCVDGFDKESWYAPVHPSIKARRANDYDWAITHDVVPFIHEKCNQDSGIIVHGVSFGAYHALNFYLRHPDIFDVGIALSGNYSITCFVGNFRNDDVYFNDPLMYSQNISASTLSEKLRENLLIICSGQGAWEEWLDEAKTLSRNLNHNGIPHLLNLWGFDVAHDWPWWKNQITYFLRKLDEKNILTENNRMKKELVSQFLSDLSKS